MMRRLVLFSFLLVVVSCGATPRVQPTPAVTGQAPAASPSLLAPVSTPNSQDVHQAEGADRWYPADPTKLQAAVDAYVSQATVGPIPGRLLAVIVPHAGYPYSGAVSGYAFQAMQEAGCADSTIAVIGDTHTGNGSAKIAVWAAGAFETPLGTISVDEEVAQALVAADSRIEFDREAFEAEHPVENQLPFIQAVCPGARIVPIVIRKPSLENAQALADALVAALRPSQVERKALIVASTDLSHYHPYEEAQQMDEVALQAITSLDPQAVAESPRRCAELGLGGGDTLTMCSQGAVMVALIAARQMGANQATILYHATSGDVPLGDRTQVVGYGAVALWQSTGEGTLSTPPSPAYASNPQSPISNTLPLSPKAQEELLTLARQTAAQYLSTETFPSFQTDDPVLLQSLGAYVTYEKGGALRGCLGRLEADRPAYLNVQYAAVAAALGDPRFPPVTPEELKELTIEITLLQPMRQVTSPDEIQIGRDGVLMRLGENQGALFLPQVAPQEGWDLPATLLNLCRKAGLADDCWQRRDARFYALTGQWFGEDE